MKPFLGGGCRWWAQYVSCHQVVERTSTCNATVDVWVREKLNQKDLDHEEDEVRNNLGVREKWGILIATLNKSNTHHSGALVLKHLVHIVQGDKEHIQANKELVNLSVQKSQESIIPIHELNVAVHIGNTVHAPDWQRVSPINLRITVYLIGLHKLDDNNRRKNQDDREPSRQEVFE